MYIKKHLIYILVGIMIFAGAFYVLPQNYALAGTELEPVPEILSESAVVYSADTKEKLISIQSTTKYYPYSITKLMTAILAVENAERSSDYIPKSSETVTVGKEILTLPEGYISAGFEVGDVVSLPDLITAAVVCNADDAAITIGTYIGRKKLGGVPDTKYNYDKVALDYFITMMNHKLNLMGLNQTTFTNCTGYDGGITSHTSAEDAARISAEFVSYKFLRDIASKYSVKYWDFDDSEVQAQETADETDSDTEPDEIDKIQEARKSRWTTENQLMNADSSYYYEYCKGLIAGKTSEDKIYISAYAEYHDISVIVVVMNSDPETAYNDIINLFDYVFNNYVMHTFIEDGQKVAEYYVKNAMDPSNEHLSVLASGGGKHLSRIDKLDLFGYEIRIDSRFFSPTEADLYDRYVSPSGGITMGDILGTMDIYYNAVYIDTVVLYAGNTVPVFENLPVLTTRKWYQDVDWSNILLIVAVFVLLVFIFIVLVSISNKIKKQKLVKRRYALNNVQKKPAVHYNKKKM